MYFIISNNDGDTYIETATKEQITKRLEEKYYGEEPMFKSDIERSDTNYWGDNILIIKGEIVVPKPKKVVETFEV